MESFVMEKNSKFFFGSVVVVRVMKEKEKKGNEKKPMGINSYKF